MNRHLACPLAPKSRFGGDGGGGSSSVRQASPLHHHPPRPAAPVPIPPPPRHSALRNPGEASTAIAGTQKPGLGSPHSATSVPRLLSPGVNRGRSRWVPHRDPKSAIRIPHSAIPPPPPLAPASPVRYPVLMPVPAVCASRPTPAPREPPSWSVRPIPSAAFRAWPDVTRPKPRSATTAEVWSAMSQCTWESLVWQSPCAVPVASGVPPEVPAACGAPSVSGTPLPPHPASACRPRGRPPKKATPAGERG